MTNFSTPQEQFWAGQFGDDYTDRNTGARWDDLTWFLLEKSS